MLFHNKYSFLNINVLYFRISRRYNMGINDFIQIGSTIKELRKAKGISQKEMSKLLDIPYSTYSNYENNNREPSADVIKKVSDILEISTDSLIETAKTKSKTFIDEIDMYVEKFQKDIAERGYNREMGDIELLKYFRKLNYEGQDKAIDYTKLLSESPKYQKDYTKDNGTVYAAHEPTDIENTNNSEE